MRRSPAVQTAVNQIQSLGTIPGMGRVARHAQRELRTLEEVMLSLESRRARFLAIARKCAIQIARNNPEGIVTVDDVRTVCPPLADMDPRVMGAIFNNKRTFEAVGYVNSTRRDCHHRPIRQFRVIAVN